MTTNGLLLKIRPGSGKQADAGISIDSLKPEVYRALPGAATWHGDGWPEAALSWGWSR